MIEEDQPSGTLEIAAADWHAAGRRSWFVEVHDEGEDRQSIHGDIRASGAGNSGAWKMSNAQIICSQVVPCLERALMTMSPSRWANCSHRALSSSGDAYRRGITAGSPGSAASAR